MVPWIRHEASGSFFTIHDVIEVALHGGFGQSLPQGVPESVQVGSVPRNPSCSNLDRCTPDKGRPKQSMGLVYFRTFTIRINQM